MAHMGLHLSMVGLHQQKRSQVWSKRDLQNLARARSLIVGSWKAPMSDASRCRKFVGLTIQSCSGPRSSTEDQIADDEGNGLLNHQRPLHIMFQHLYTLAAHALAEGELKSEPDDSWKEPYDETSAWKPCSDDLDNEMSSSYSKKTNTGYIMVSANGGLNQQRVAICNAVAVARLLNATLVIPKFLYSSVWQDNSQFGDIYQQDFFIDYLKNDITIVHDLPLELRSLDLEAIGSFRLRCKCNFHALKFTPQIQKIAALLIQRMREQSNRWGPVLDEPDIPGYANHTQTQVISHLIVDTLNNGENILESKGLFHNVRKRTFRYLGLHLRFEIDMAAYSMCDFGGGEIERHELERYREIHFPTLWTYQKKGKLPTAVELRKHGKCPLMPEESVLMLAALGFKRATRVYLAGAEFYGSSARMAALTYLYPNLVTKEDLLTPEELRPLINSSSQLAALDFIVCAAADAFAMTDSGSQFSSLVSGYRIYYGGGLLPTIRPNKRRLAAIFAKNKTIEWQEFSTRVRKTIKESKKVTVRPIARSVYRHPRCPECMCRKSNTDGPKRP